MLKLVWIGSNLFLIFLILIQIPNNTGLESIAGKSDFLGSPNTANKIIKIISWVFIFIYLLLACKYNLQS
jgi:protein translocase SecG subunit|tara:strand:- start:434 stop:643 length:210 start_codon:yes stop_codon:yes gene_type:complete